MLEERQMKLQKWMIRVKNNLKVYFIRFKSEEFNKEGKDEKGYRYWSWKSR